LVNFDSDVQWADYGMYRAIIFLWWKWLIGLVF